MVCTLAPPDWIACLSESDFWASICCLTMLR